MQVMAFCRKEKMNFTLSQVLRTKSIHQLAQSARFDSDRVFQEEKVEEHFELSPIQKLYFQAKSADKQGRDTRFNQSFLLHITREVAVERIRDAVFAIVDQHSMLRARLSKNSGRWQQRITEDTGSSIRFQSHSVDLVTDISRFTAMSQESLNIEQGPLFTVDLFNTSDQKQIIFMAAHHLVIDMMSWRIILGDLEEFITTGKIASDKPMSFQVRNRSQFPLICVRNLQAPDIFP